MARFEGSIRKLRRGGWRARALVISARHGQLVETQLGPIECASECLCDAWLREASAGFEPEDVRIVSPARPAIS
jgi:hypothetical protein